jgi:ATP-binding cassette, subfamily A (ABC1), member 3
MDEADVLGDAIAIMAEGQLRCCGSSLFLKSRFGVGYQLNIEKAKRMLKSNRIGSDRCDIESETYSNSGDEEDDTSCNARLAKIVQGGVENAALLSTAAGEIKFQLPMKGSHSFVQMLRRLDTEVAKGRIDSYGLSLTTLEEVFVLVSRGEGICDKEIEPSSKTLSLHKKGRIACADDFERDKLFMRHVRALFKKRWLSFKRDRRAWLFTTILPSLLVFLGFLFYDSLEVFAVWFLVVL